MAKRARERQEPTVNTRLANKYGFQAKISPDQDRYISPNQAGRILNVTGEAVKQWIYRRRLPAVKLGNGYWKINVKDLEAYFRSRQDVGQRRILVIKEDETVTNDLLKAIQGGGNEPVVANNLSDALLKAADLQPSLFIVHYKKNFDEIGAFVKRIRSHRNLRRLPILMISDTELTEAESTQVMDWGIQGVLKNPASVKMIQEEIEKILTRIM